MAPMRRNRITSKRMKTTTMERNRTTTKMKRRRRTKIKAKNARTKRVNSKKGTNKNTHACILARTHELMHTRLRVYASLKPHVHNY